jgi:hypothetical protein
MGGRVEDDATGESGLELSSPSERDTISEVVRCNGVREGRRGVAPTSGRDVVALNGRLGGTGGLRITLALGVSAGLEGLLENRSGLSGDRKAGGIGRREGSMRERGGSSNFKGGGGARRVLFGFASFVSCVFEGVDEVELRGRPCRSGDGGGAAHEFARVRVEWVGVEIGVERARN